MVVEPIELSIETRGDLVHPVAPEETAIEGGYPGAFLLYDLTIEIDESLTGHRTLLPCASTKKGRPDSMGTAA